MMMTTTMTTPTMKATKSTMDIETKCRVVILINLLDSIWQWIWRGNETWPSFWPEISSHMVLSRSPQGRHYTAELCGMHKSFHHRTQFYRASECRSRMQTFIRRASAWIIAQRPQKRTICNWRHARKDVSLHCWYHSYEHALAPGRIVVATTGRYTITLRIP